MRKVILVVEDDPDLRETLLEILETADFEVVAAANGRDALLALQAGFRASLVLLDMRMPVMDGREFRRRQLSIADLADVPVVLLSASSAAAGDGSPDFPNVLMKPFGRDALLELVSFYCRDDSSSD